MIDVLQILAWIGSNGMPTIVHQELKKFRGKAGSALIEDQIDCLKEGWR